MSGQDYEQLTLFPAGSPASPFLQPGSAEARKMTVTSGLKCSALCRSYGPLGSLARTLLGSSAWRSTRCLLTWKVSATPARRLLFRLVPSTPHTGGTDVQSWPTPRANDAKKRGKISADPRNGLPGAVALWPTPSASDGGRTAINPIWTKNGTVRHQNKQGGQSFARLDQVAAMFPTPKASDYKGSGPPGSKSAEHDRRKGNLKGVVMYATPQARDYRTGQAERWQNPEKTTNLNDQVGGQLNPTWVEWLMGLPLGGQT